LHLKKKKRKEAIGLILKICRLGYNASCHGSIIVFEERRGTTEGTKYVRMLYLTSHSLGLGSGTLTYMRGGRDEDDDGFPTQPVVPSLPKPYTNGPKSNANERNAANYEFPSFSNRM
jgi:hypothetical protein